MLWAPAPRRASLAVGDAAPQKRGSRRQLNDYPHTVLWRLRHIKEVQVLVKSAQGFRPD